MKTHPALNLNLGLRWSLSCHWDITTAETDAPPWSGFWSWHMALGPVAIGLVYFREIGR